MVGELDKGGAIRTTAGGGQLSERDLSEAVLQTAGALVVVLDANGAIVRFNRACETATDYSAEEVRGRRVWDLLIAPEEVESVKRVFGELRSGMFPNHHENFWVAKDGSRRLIDWSNTALVDDAGAVRWVIGTGIDITERRAAEQELERQRAFVASVLDGVPHPFLVIDPHDYRVQYMNAAGRALLRPGASTCYALTHGLSEPCQLPDHPCPLREVQRTRAPTSAAHVHTDARGRAVQVRVYAAPVLDEQGEVSQVIEHIVDVSDVKRADARLRTYQRSLVELASKLSLAEERERRRISLRLHDVAAQNLALAVLQLRAAEEAGAAGQSSLLAPICELVERTAMDLRSMSHSLSPPSLYAAGLVGALESLAERFEAERGIPCSFLARVGVREVEVPEDTRKIVYRCVRELLANAAAHAGGCAIVIELSCERGQLEVAVSDDGAGFEPPGEELGLDTLGGFGLFSIQEQMRSLGGRLTLHSAPARGTRVTLQVPSAQESNASSMPPGAW